jgi:hypothetical protein
MVRISFAIVVAMAVIALGLFAFRGEEADSTAEFDQPKTTVTTQTIMADFDSPAPLASGIQNASHATPVDESRDLHREIRELRGDVGQLRHDVKQLLGVLEGPRKSSGGQGDHSQSAEERRIERVLAKPVTLKIQNKPLSDFLSDTAAAHDVNIVLDKLGLVEVGLTAQAPIALDVRDIRLATALQLVLDPMDLTCTVRDDVLVVTSVLRAQGGLVVAIYPVGNLIMPIRDSVTISEKPQVSASTASTVSLLKKTKSQTLVDLITSTIEPTSWAEVGGRGSIRSHLPTLSLVIRQTQPVHEEIADVLDKLRRLQQIPETLSREEEEKLLIPPE